MSGEGSQPSDEQIEWTTEFCGVDARAVQAAPVAGDGPKDQEAEHPQDYIEHPDIVERERRRREKCQKDAREEWKVCLFMADQLSPEERKAAIAQCDADLQAALAAC